MFKYKNRHTKIRVPVPSKPEKSMKTAKDVLEEAERHKKTAEYLRELDDEEASQKEEDGEGDE